MKIYLTPGSSISLTVPRKPDKNGGSLGEKLEAVEKYYKASYFSPTWIQC